MNIFYQIAHSTLPISTNGFSKRHLGFHQGAKEILAGTCDHHVIAHWCATGCRRRKQCCTLHLFFVLMSAESKSANPSKTVLIITVGFLVLYFFSKQNVFLYIAIGVGLLGSISDFLAEQIDWLWTNLGWVLSLIVPNIIMTIIFYLVLTPTAFLSRLFGKSDPMDLKNTQASLFKEKKETTFSTESFEKPW